MDLQGLLLRVECLPALQQRRVAAIVGSVVADAAGETSNSYWVAIKKKTLESGSICML